MNPLTITILGAAVDDRFWGLNLGDVVMDDFQSSFVAKG